MKITNKIVQHFCKTFGVNFPVKEEEYFIYYIDLYDTIYKTKEKWNIYNNALSLFKNEEDFFSHLTQVVDSIILMIQEKEEYKEFQHDNSVTEKKLPYAISKNAPYNLNNVGKRYLSIDLEKANFQAVNYYNKTILDADSYDEFIKKALPFEKDAIIQLLIASKKHRQIIFGNLVPKKITFIESMITQKILQAVEKKLPDFEKRLSIVACLHDEIFFEINELDEKDDSLKSEIESIIDATSFHTHIDIFSLHTVIDGRKWFFKKFIDGKIKLLCIPADFIPQVIRYLNGEEIQSADMKFMYEGQVAKFSKPII